MGMVDIKQTLSGSFLCITCDKPARYIFHGSSYCEEHYKESSEKIKLQQHVKDQTQAKFDAEVKQIKDKTQLALQQQVNQLKDKYNNMIKQALQI